MSRALASPPVNALGERKTAADRNGTVHPYGYDVVGRFLTDAVTTLGDDVEGSVRRQEVASDSAGRAFRFTTYDAASAGNVVTQVERVFNGLGQLTKEYQEHSGAVSQGTSQKVESTSSVVVNGTANPSRPVPSGRPVRPPGRESRSLVEEAVHQRLMVSWETPKRSASANAV